MARLKEVYKKEIVPALVKQFGYKSAMEVPRLSKIVLNMGVGELRCTVTVTSWALTEIWNCPAGTPAPARNAAAAPWAAAGSGLGGPPRAKPP